MLNYKDESSLIIIFIDKVSNGVIDASDLSSKIPLAVVLYSKNPLALKIKSHPTDH